MIKHLLLFLSFLTLLASSLTAQVPNVLIDNLTGASEPSICIDLSQTNNQFAGANFDNFYYSTDNGLTWKINKIGSSYGSTGDPCLTSDLSGNIYFFHLSGNGYDRIVCQKLNKGSMTFNNGSYAWNSNNSMQDKEWATVDPVSKNIYVTWTQYDAGLADSSRIFFSRSTDLGQSFSVPKRINQIAGDCNYLDITDPHPFVGPSGEVYVTFMDSVGIRFNRSLDSGATWLPSQPVIDSGGDFRYYDISGVSRIRAMPYNACDLSTSANRGTLYVVWADNRNGKDNCDIFFSRSKDGGNTWSKAAKINQDNTLREQYRPAFTIDQTTGNLYVVCYDRRNTQGDSTEIYLLKSIDGGNSWSETRVFKNSYYSTASWFEGDYIDIKAHNGVVRPVWARTDGFGTSIWTALINEKSSGVHEIQKLPPLFSLNPNPANVITALTFPEKSYTGTIEIYDSKGMLVQNSHVDLVTEWILDVRSLKNGFYIVKAGTQTSRLIINHP